MPSLYTSAPLWAAMQVGVCGAVRVDGTRDVSIQAFARRGPRRADLTLAPQAGG